MLLLRMMILALKLPERHAAAMQQASFLNLNDENTNNNKMITTRIMVINFRQYNYQNAMQQAFFLNMPIALLKAAFTPCLHHLHIVFTPS
jgi:hypothetical protein